MFDNRRSVIKSLGFGGAVIAAAQKRSSAQTANTPQIDRIANELHDAIRGYQLDDTHCHAVTDQYAETTPREFLLATSLAALPQAAYFPAGVLQRWRTAERDEKATLDRQYGIEKTIDLMAYNASETIFTKYLTKELAGFLKCAPKFETVIAARNERARAGYGRYISDLFRDIHLTNAMVNTGCCDGIGAGVFTTYAEGIRPCTMRAIARIETIQNFLFQTDISFDDLESRYTESVRNALDGTGNFGFKSWGMKWHQLERLGVVKPHYDSAAAKKSWDDFKSSRGTTSSDREADADRGRRLKEYLLPSRLRSA